MNIHLHNLYKSINEFFLLGNKITTRHVIKKWTCFNTMFYGEQNIHKLSFIQSKLTPALCYFVSFFSNLVIALLSLIVLFK